MAIREDDRELAAARREERERQRLSHELAFFRFAADAGAATQPDPAPAAAADGTRADRLLWQLRQVYDWDGRLEETERQARIEAGTRASLERWLALREEWNRQVDRAEKQGVHVIYTGEYHMLRSELKTATRDDPYLAPGPDYGVQTRDRFPRPRGDSPSNGISPYRTVVVPPMARQSG